MKKIILYVAIIVICTILCIILFKVILIVLAKFVYVPAFLVAACVAALLFVPEKQIEHFSPKAAKFARTIKNIIKI
jgi:hypothetical protein